MLINNHILLVVMQEQLLAITNSFGWATLMTIIGILLLVFSNGQLLGILLGMIALAFGIYDFYKYSIRKKQALTFRK